MQQPLDFLLPAPRSCEIVPGSPIQLRRLRPDLRVQDDRLQRSCRRLTDALAIGRNGHRGATARDIPLTIAVDASSSLPPDGYRLEMGADRVALVGPAASGCFYGLETLTRLAVTCTDEVPPCRIEDWPDFRTRGLLHDVTRGKVPTLDTLKHLVDRLAMWKVNQLQLNIEHAFTFSFDPEICRESDGLTPDEVRELDAYCRDRFVELVPALATLGHMGKILSMPRYRHLAEIETGTLWNEMNWPQRMRGLTLDCLNPDAHRLIECMCGDIMDAFSAPHINACGDEPHDLGKGKNAKELTGGARLQAYVDHLRRIHDFCAARDRRVMCWCDVLKTYPEMIHRLPDDVTLLHWGYGDEAEYDLTDKFVSTGLDTFVCPGSSGWKRILNAMDLAERNIDTFAQAGIRAGAKGLLNTDWGDHGHFNMPASSWHGIALGACKAWWADHPIGTDFDHRLSTYLWGIDDGECLSMLRRASRPAARLETWRLFWQPLQATRDELNSMTRDEVESMRLASRSAQQLLADASLKTCSVDPSTASSADITELMIACRFLDLLADKVDMACEEARGDSGASVQAAAAEWSNALTEAARDFAACWRARNKPSGLEDILRALSRTGEDMMASIMP